MVEPLIKIEIAKTEQDMIVFLSTSYTKTKKNDKTIVNDTFQLIEKIGHGSFWSVRKVKRNLISDSGELLDNNYYVFKEGCLSKRADYFLDDNSEESRIGLNEYNLLKSLCHVNITRLFECIIDDKQNKIVFVMEYCDLGALMNVIEEDHVYNTECMDYLWKYHYSNKAIPKKYSFEIEEQKEFFIKITKEIFKQLASAVKYLHDKLIVHLDIKPANVLIKTHDENGVFVKLSDFSISKKLKNKDEKILFFGGTPAFVPPERETEATDLFKSDIYSLGGTMFTFLFSSYNFTQKHDELEDIQLKQLIYNCLDPNPILRPDIDDIVRLVDLMN